MSNSLGGKWTHSYSEETFSSSEYYDTKEEAIQGGKEDYFDEDHFFVGKIEEIIPNISAELIIERIQEDIYEDGGDFSEGYLDNVTKEMKDELEEKLNDVLQDWLTKYKLHPTFYNVICVDCVENDRNEDSNGL